MTDQTPDPLDVTLSESLQTRWPARGIPERQINTLLATLETQNRKITMQTRLSALLRPVAFAGGLALLVLTLSWIFGAMRPNPASEITPTPEEGNPALTESAVPNVIATPEGEVIPTPAPTPALPATGFSSMPNITFDFALPFPDAPSQITLYQQRPEGELTEDAVRAVAAQMGLNGPVTSYPGEGGDTIYNVTDGDLQMIFYGFPDQFTYAPATYTPPTLAAPLPFDQRVAIAEAFLKAHGLLDYPYRAEPSATDPNGIRFVELLDGIPLVYGIGKNPGLIERINISIHPDGQISSLFHSRHNYQPLDAYPLLTAEQAWGRLSQPDAETRARYAVLAPPMSWTRAGTGAETFTGYLSNENGDTTFYADDGRTLTLLDIPTDMPLYPTLQIRGTVTENGLDWSAMTLMDYGYGSSLSCGGGGGGGGGYFPDANFGGGNFAMVVLDPSAPPQAGYVSPLQPGDAVDGVQGVLFIIRRASAGGTETNQYNFWLAGDENNPGWSATLEGEALTGTERLQNLPINIWGTVSRLDENGTPIIAVDRYEEAYPGTRIQAWLVTQQVVTLEGQEVVLLTAQDGSQFVSNQSILWGPEGSMMGMEGEALLIEGYLLPDKTFGGYPVIHELMGSVSNGVTSLDGYIIRSSLIDIQEDFAYANPASTLTGHITIASIELMYAAVTLGRCTADFVNNPDYAHFLYAQPVWRFSGTFADGRTFEVQIQALPDEYLR